MKIDAPVVVVITDGESHARLFAPILVERNARRITNLFKRAVALVDVKLVRRRVVDDDQIEQIVVVDVNKRRAKAIVLLRIVYPCLDAHVFKRAVRFLVIERVTFAGQSARTAHHRHAAKLAEVLSDAAGFSCFARTWRQVVEIDLNVTGNKKIEAPVAVVIAPACSGAPTFARDAGFVRNVGKGAVAVVAVKTRDAEVADKHVGTTVVVVIADRDTEAPTLVRDARQVRAKQEKPAASDKTSASFAACRYVRSSRTARRR